MTRSLAYATTALLFFAFALPAAASDATPDPTLYGTDAAGDSGEVEILGATEESVDCTAPEGALCDVPVAIELLSSDPQPCSDEVAAAAGTENQIIADAPCLLPDGTLYTLAAKGGDVDLAATSGLAEEQETPFWLLGIAAAVVAAVLVVRRQAARR
jgi:hypothetical protein